MWYNRGKETDTALHATRALSFRRKSGRELLSRGTLRNYEWSRAYLCCSRAGLIATAETRARIPKWPSRLSIAPFVTHRSAWRVQSLSNYEFDQWISILAKRLIDRGYGSIKTRRLDRSLLTVSRDWSNGQLIQWFRSINKKFTTPGLTALYTE